AASEKEARINLDSVYTALLTYSPREHEQWLQGKSMDRDIQRMSALEQLNEHEHLVLLGEPGSGKTTFVDFVVLCLCGEALGDEKINLKLLRTPVPQKDENKSQQKWKYGALLPVRVVLRDFAERGLPPVGEKATSAHLLNFIEKELESHRLSEFAPFLEKELKDKGGLLLIDGLDEVSEADRRRDQIKQAIEDFRSVFFQCRILVTSRTYAYQKQEWMLDDFNVTVLAPFNWAQMQRFIERWYQYIGLVRGFEKEDILGKTEALKLAIRNKKNLWPMAERPLLLTLMASLHAWKGGKLPEKREQLYAVAVDVLLDFWESRKIKRREDGTFEKTEPSLTEWLSVDKDQVRAVLNELAFDVHRLQKDLNRTADIPEDELVGRLMKLSNSENLRPKQLVRYLSNRAGLLLPRGNKIYAFPHRTFQEYLAACHLTDINYPNVLAELVLQEPNRWREVALLAAAKAARGASSTIWLLVDAFSFCNADCKKGASKYCWRVHIAAQALAELGTLVQVHKHDQPKIKTLQSCLGHIMRKPDFPTLERVMVGDTLAKLGDPRSEVMTIEDMQFCYIPAGPFIMGSPENDKMAYEDEEYEHQENIPYPYWLARFSITNAQFEAFVKAEDGYSNNEWWTKAGLRWRGERTEPDKQGGAFVLPNHPVVNVGWYEAHAFTRWLTFRLRQKHILSSDWIIRLPTEAEWEKAARGGLNVPMQPVCQKMSALAFDTDVRMKENENAKRKYPWGDDMNANRLNYAETHVGNTSAVRCFPDGKSPYGCEEMSGNAREWCLTKWRREDYKSKADNDEKGNSRRVVRGGSFLNDVEDVRCAVRFGNYPNLWDGFNGFRVSLSRSSVL
ncbi:MAG: SUMF1/EgtB/PvdO family nonheme iron enzyme, partial [Actinobacteria bacterium]|nr:SUMF1/EgtB/PvdO family nonheme iron enzyme [Actinomycetota bacterium]